jgi:maltose/moltooligosaccharide transporter
LWILDAANNTAMEPYRAFIADQLPAEQRPTGFLTQSFFTGLGITLANLSLFGFQKLWGGTELTAGDGIPQWVYGSFFFGAICSIGSVWYSMATTPEVSPDPAEIERIKGLKTGVAESVKEIFSAFRDMPAIMWRLALVYLFQWYAMFCYWQFISHGIAKSIWKTTAELNPSVYAEAVGWTGLINGFYNVITFISAFGLIWLVKKSNPRMVHAFCLFWAAAGLLSIPFIENKYLLFFPMIGLGVAWASMMGVPYLLVMDYLPKERFGVYTGIVNMMIVVPMIIQTLTFGWIYGRFLGGDPTLAVGFSGVLLMAAGFLTLRVKP